VWQSFIHSLDHLTGDGSLCPPYYSITGCVPCDISGESCVDFQLLHPRMARPATWTFPLRPVVGAVTSSCLDSQMQTAVPCGPEWLLEVVLRDQTSHDVVSWSCHEHFLGQSGLWWWHWWRSRTRIPSIRRWHDMLNASSFCSSDFSSVQVSAPCRRTETTKALYSRSFVDKHNFSCLQIFVSWPIMLDACPIRRCISGADRPDELIALPRHVNWSVASTDCPCTLTGNGAGP